MAAAFEPGVWNGVWNLEVDYCKEDDDTLPCVTAAYPSPICAMGEVVYLER